MRALRRNRKLLGAVLGLYAAGTLAARRRGYPLPGKVIVRCRDGHLFTTVWIPGASLTSVRLGWWRFQRCPVGGHWTLVAPVDPTRLTEDEKQMARAAEDTRIP